LNYFLKNLESKLDYIDFRIILKGKLFINYLLFKKKNLEKDFL